MITMSQMDSPSIYLDNNATTQPLEVVTEAVVSAMESLWGNPSSIHRVGQAARHQVDLAREEIAKLIGAKSAELTFTSGGTEAANLAIQTACKARAGCNVVVTSQIEHAAVDEMMERLGDEGMEVVRLRNDKNGVFAWSICVSFLKKEQLKLQLCP